MHSNRAKQDWFREKKEFRSSGVQEFRSSGVQESNFGGTRVRKKERTKSPRRCDLVFNGDRGFLLELLNSSNSLNFFFSTPDQPDGSDERRKDEQPLEPKLRHKLEQAFSGDRAEGNGREHQQVESERVGIDHA